MSVPASGRKIAVVGTGISGLTAAYLLAKRHDVTVFEADSRIGGHTHTVDVKADGRDYAIDTGFIVFNDKTYPNFRALMAELGVADQDTVMSFSVKCEKTGLEYNGTNLNTLFARRRNLLNPLFYRMIGDILRFNKEAPSDVAFPEIASLTVGEYLERNMYCRRFIDHYIQPMGSAIWSCGKDTLLDFPLQFFVRFFHNHGMLSVNDRPVWHTIVGGSRAYLDPLCASFREKIHTNTPVKAIRRTPNGVRIRDGKGQESYFDDVVLAVHSNLVAPMVEDLEPAAREVFDAMPYQVNDVVLHTHVDLMPKRKLAWAAWNYHIGGDEGAVRVTYNMNILQRLKSETTFMVSLNCQVPEEKILGRYRYDHPVYTLAGIKARNRYDEINGVNHLFYCGAYWFNGFHEDGVRAAQRAVAAMEGGPVAF